MAGGIPQGGIDIKGSPELAKFDKSGDGKLDKKELEDMIKSMLEKAQQKEEAGDSKGAEEDEDKLAKMLAKLLGISEEDAKKLIKGIKEGGQDAPPVPGGPK